MIKFLDLQSQYASLRGEMDPAIAGILRDATFIGGAPVQAFEREFAAYLESDKPRREARDLRGTASLTYSFNAEWSLTGAVTVRSLQGDVKRSPIVNEDTPVAGVLALSYSF